MEEFVQERMDQIIERVRAEMENISKWEAFEAQIAQRRAEASDVMELNVGGKLITTFRSTLTKYPDTLLGAMFSGRHEITKDKQGRAFIDRDPAMFKIILQWLRTGVAPKVSQDMADVLQFEVDYYGLNYVFPQPPHVLASFELIVGKPFDMVGVENTASALLDGSFKTAVCTHCSAPTITFKFVTPVVVSGISIAGYFEYPMKWPPSNGQSAAVEFLDDQTGEWRQVGSVPADFGKTKQLHTIRWAPQRAAQWRLRNNAANNKGYLGLSQAILLN